MVERRDDVTRGGATATAPDATATDTHYKADGRDSERIRKDIRHTRDEMHGTLEAIENRLSPQRIWNEITETFRDEVRRSRFLRTLRDNPIPVMMLTAGAAWLTIDATRPHHTYEVEISEGGTREEGTFSKIKSKLSGAKDKAAGAIGAMKDKAQQARQSAGEKMLQGGQGAQDTKARLQEGTARAKEKAGHARDEATARFQEHPLAIGALAAAAGMAVGLLTPPSHTEDELMGEASRKAKQRIGQAGEEIAERGKQVGQAAAQAAESEAEKQNLAPEGQA